MIWLNAFIGENKFCIYIFIQLEYIQKFFRQPIDWWFLIEGFFSLSFLFTSKLRNVFVPSTTALNTCRSSISKIFIPPLDFLNVSHNSIGNVFHFSSHDLMGTARALNRLRFIGVVLTYCCNISFSPLDLSICRS